MILSVEDYLKGIENDDHRAKFKKVLQWVSNSYSELDLIIKYNTPMFTAHGTYITGFNAAKNHYSMGLEGQEIVKVFVPALEKAGLKYGHKTIQVPWDIPLPEKLFKDIIDYRLEQKENIKTFWLPSIDRVNPDK